MVEKDLAGLTSRVSTAMIVLSTFAVGLRFIARKWSKTDYRYDDWFALASLPFTLGISISFYFAIAHGYATPKGDVQYYYRIIYVNELLWFTSFLFTKLSVLFFYHRVFGSKMALRWTLYTIGAITVLWWVVITFIAIFQCTPVTGSIAAPGSNCLKPLPFFYAQTIPNLITDFAILLVPMPILWQLQMRLTKKLGLILIFTIGYFVPIISIVRIIYFVQLSQKRGKHSAYDTALTTIWSILETAFALVGACVPTMTIVARRSIELVSHSFASLLSLSDSTRSRNPKSHQEKDTTYGKSVELLHREPSNISSKNMPSYPPSSLKAKRSNGSEIWQA